MEKLLKYLNSLSKQGRADFCRACGTSERYLRKAISVKQQLGAGLCINIDRESGAEVEVEDLAPSIDWAYLRGKARRAV